MAQIFSNFIKNGYVPHLHFGADQWVRQNEVNIGKDYLFIPKEKLNKQSLLVKKYKMLKILARTTMSTECYEEERFRHIT